MRTALIGHRGVGKSSFLTRVETYYQGTGRPVECLDLDREVVRRAGHGIHEIFAREGEEGFRRLERETFREIEAATQQTQHDVFIALGAGYDPALISPAWRVLWLRRISDSRGRIFVDRPRLNDRVPALEEFRERYPRRHSAYRLRADDTLWLDEGCEAGQAVEKDFVLGELRNLQGALTVLPEQFHSPGSVERWVQQRLKWGLRWFELRDDLLTSEQIETAVRLLPDDRVLMSFRSAEHRLETERRIEQHGLSFDWPCEMGVCEFGEPRILSLHLREPGESISQALARFPTDLPEGTLLKAALPTHDFHDLQEAHVWQQTAPESRVFLPMSEDGRWAWYRLRHAHPSLGFLREGDGSGVDQPTLLAWARQRRIDAQIDLRPFAAVLGDPVAHSRTPCEQQDFFALRQAAVYAIRVSSEDWEKNQALEWLRAQGLKWAAVTAPLKTLAFASAQTRDRLCQDLGAANTLVATANGWSATNTDLEGFRELAHGADFEGGPVAVWGGGGTLQVIGKILPQAQFFSVRSGKNRNEMGLRTQDFLPHTVVWAAGMGADDLPPAHWQPRLVIDLNYVEDSPARTFAMAKKARYVSGLKMFQAQAAGQRFFWENS